ncbi:peptide/nickel transport system ATP-binding protein [Spinactinospora alkalitolerans]|uniref:Peptide/nickel transport system ATP-binding protein n=1 Tax=Spinactinospora alkalitolerans TaxID=687207 RepID=A0A852TVV5_9ACTN|nr:ATP-binding cassette domain-containing protein [Spinactinospora alkalitolerans]NYE47851.1 peptide/nickel transport system ATP-binding protein [Spinactinospora alkalitolerans]
MSEPLVEVESVRKAFPTGSWPRRGEPTVAVDDVSFQVVAGESLGIVGESGSGKSTLAGVICGLTKPDSGRVRVKGREIHAGRRFDRTVWRSVQMVFQDPYTSLNPSMTIEEIVAEPLRLWHGVAAPVARRRAGEILDRVGLSATAARRRAGGLSGGQRQRASIARALAVSPEVIVLDESVSALDVSVQAQILELLLELKRDTGLTYLLISHDISVIRVVCSRVLVMRRGQVVEECPAEDLTAEGATHEYTRRLLSAVPMLSAANG